jgi:hypothetical protein
VKAFVFAALLASSALFAQTPPGKTTEQQARSYIVSAFMTGAAPMLLAEDVTVTLEAWHSLGLPQQADGRDVYNALVKLTGATSPNVRPPTAEEMTRAKARGQPGMPAFALEAGERTFVLLYDLQRDVVTFVGEVPQAVAVALPVKPVAAPERVPDPPAPPAPAPVAEAPAAPPAVPQAAVEAPKPAAAAPAPQVVEPREPRMAKPAPPPVAKPAPVQAARSPEPRLPPLRANGPCVIKPVMSDQDLVNCGATPR